MIKMDIISGFLGVGKTTLIKRYLETLSAAGEKVVLIENDFGSIGIDKDLFTIGELDIYEVNKGCLCCSLKGTFINTLIEIADKVKPDRVILEPSGIFILSEIFELFRYCQISDNYEINSVVTVIDGLHFKEHQVGYGNFLINQIENAGTLLVSKTDLMENDEVLDIVNELADEFTGREIIARTAADLTDEEILSLFKGDEKLHGKILVGEALKEKRRERTHMGFSSYSFYDEIPLSSEDLAAKLQTLNSKEFGDIIRAKGFVRNAQTENEFLEFHYVDGTIEIKPNPKKDLKAGLCFIGRGLDKDSLENLFQ
ncbi:MAG: GTP-binding protein [Bacillota bacterium]|nr:GTP-binding protein [Bacillota bacterium]